MVRASARDFCKLRKAISFTQSSPTPPMLEGATQPTKGGSRENLASPHGTDP